MTSLAAALHVTLRWPATGAPALTEAHLALLWVATTYFTFQNRPDLLTTRGEEAKARADRVGFAAAWRALIMFGGVLMIVTGRHGAEIVLGAVLAGIVAALTAIRGWIGAANKADTHTNKSGTGVWRLGAYGAELEVLAAGTALAVITLMVAAYDLETRVLATVPAPPHRVAIVLASLAIIGFAARGGQHIVRGVLEKGQTLPVFRPAADADAAGDGAPRTSPDAAAGAQRTTGDSAGASTRITAMDYQRGRIIGVLERTLLVVLVAAGSYEALAFITAAKGLIRAKELESRNFAEYFLIGTMSSVTIALVLGLALRYVIRAW